MCGIMARMADARALGVGRPGPVRAAFRRSDGYGQLSELDRVAADRIAAAVDRAAADGDTRLMLTAWRELRRFTAEDVERTEHSDSDSDGGRAAILDLFRRGPAMGDAADA